MCEKRGHAIAVTPRRVGSPEFLDAVRRVLSDPGIRGVAQDVRRAYADADGAAASARIIEASL
jgi:UDP:flavonoid glycosyltransferase YjiC (YdhE family)